LNQSGFRCVSVIPREHTSRRFGGQPRLTAGGRENEVANNVGGFLNYP